MAKRQGRLLLVTAQEGADDDERVVWRDAAYDQIMPLPLSWKLWRADCQLLQQESKDPELSGALQAQLGATRPTRLNCYVMHKGSMYVGCVGASEIAPKLRNGRADVTVYAEPVAADNDDTVVGLSRRGMLVSMEPADAASVYKTRAGYAGVVAPVDSHPIVMTRKSIAGLSGELPEVPPSRFAQTMNSAMKLASPGSRQKQQPPAAPKTDDKGDDAGGEGGEAGEDEEDMNTQNNPIIQLIMGGGLQPNTPALRVRLDVALYPLDPRTLQSLIRWQQKNGLLPSALEYAANCGCRGMLMLAWRLSSFSSNQVVRLVLPVAAALAALAAWLVTYVHVDAVRKSADDAVASIHARLPENLQTLGADVWHALLPAWLLQQAAPSFLAVVVIPTAALAVLLMISMRYAVVFTIQRVLLPMSRQAGVYTMSVTACEALGDQEWQKLQASEAERPDFKSQISNNGWITDDIQERYWNGAGHSAKKTKSGLQSTSEWRKKMGIDSILTVRGGKCRMRGGKCRLKSKQPHFHVMKKAFPHGMLAMSKDKHIVFLMKLGVLHKQYSLLEDAGVSNDDMVKHLALVYEHFFQNIDAATLPGGRIINLLDMEGLGIMDMKGKAAKLGNLASKVSEHHYPDRLHRALLINCPGMINQMWGVVKNMLDKNARDRTSLFTKGDTLSGLREILDDEEIPEEWGGKRKKGIYMDTREVDLFKIVAKNNGCDLKDLAIDDGSFDPSAVEGEKS